MNWDASMPAFVDELRKIAGISISGLSPETVLNAPKAEPMETPGLDKARSILAKAEMFKTAAKKKPKPIIAGYSLPTVSERAPVQRNAWDAVKPAAGHTLAGMGAGRLISEFRPGGASSKAKFVGMAAGGALGAADYAYQKLRARQPAVKTAAATPGMALKASQQVGKVTQSRSLGATLRKFTPTIGKRGTLPTP